MTGKKNRLLAIISLLAAVGLFFLGGFFLRSAYRRIEIRLLLMNDAVETQGILTEKTTFSDRDIIVPVSVNTARYTFTNADGVTRNGQQDLTAAEYTGLPETGSPVTVYFRGSDSAFNAIARKPGFPGAAGWRAAAGILLVSFAAWCAGMSITLLRKFLPPAGAEGGVKGD